MMTATFIVLVGTLILWSIWHARTAFNLFTILAAPYFFIVIINAAIAHPRFGFFPISDEVLLMLLGGLAAFFVGSVPFSKPDQDAGQLTVEEKLGRYDLNAMTIAVLAIGIVSFARVTFAFATGGVDASTFDESTGALGTGLVGHLNLMAASMLPIVLLHGIRDKDLRAIVGPILVMLSVFATFIKYNIICLVIAMAFFFVLNDRRTAKKAVVVIAVSSVSLFLVNYYIGFAYRGVSTNVSPSFYFNHLWAYIVGSTIYDNYIFTLGIREGVGTIEKLMTFFFALPNMFLNKFLGVRLFVHERQAPLFVSVTGATSNVVDAIGYLYPSKGGPFEVALFLFVMLYIGFAFSALVRLMLSHSRDRFNTTLPFFLSEFVLMSFFGTFYINAGPWEQLVYCAVIPGLFLSRQRVPARTAGTHAPQGRPTATGLRLGTGR